MSLYSRFFLAIVILTLSLVISPIASQRISAGTIETNFAGSTSYSVQVLHSDNKLHWKFNIYADGYEGQPDGTMASPPNPVDEIMADLTKRRLVIVSAMNYFDKTGPKRLTLGEIAMACWERSGSPLAQPEQIIGWQVYNTDFVNAVRDCREMLYIASDADFEVSMFDSSIPEQHCWRRLGSTFFSGSIERARERFKLDQLVMKIKVYRGEAREWRKLVEVEMLDNVVFSFS